MYMEFRGATRPVVSFPIGGDLQKTIYAALSGLTQDDAL